MPGRLPEAKECLQKATQLAPTDPVSWLGYGEVYEKLELWDDAGAAFPDAYSGMKIVNYMYAAFLQFMPGADVGIDLLKEYAAMKGE